MGGKQDMDASTLSSPDAIAAAARQRGEPDWLAAFRLQGCRAWQELPAPDRAEHLWRYTDPAQFEPEGDPFLFLAEKDPVVAEVSAKASSAGAPARARSLDGAPEALLDAAPDEFAASGRILGGILRRSGVDPELARAGVVLMDLQTAAAEMPEALHQAFGKTVGPEFGRFEALNAAAFRGGAFLLIPRGLAIEKPIHILETPDQQGFGASRLAVVVEEGASVTLIHELEGGPEAGNALFFGAAEVAVGPNARVHFVTVQNAARNVRMFVTQRSRLGHGASIVPVIASFGGALAKFDTGVFLDGEGSSSEMIGFLCGVGRQRFDNHTVQHHRGLHTRSNLDFKTVLKDRSRSAYTGLIRIETAARYSEAYQENRNLLLSETCRADSIPELEILNEEVQCKHGATVGPLDPNHLFYLMSRGIPRDEAIRMVVEGYFEPALRSLPAALRERLARVVRERLREI